MSPEEIQKKINEIQEQIILVQSFMLNMSDMITNLTKTINVLTEKDHVLLDRINEVNNETNTHIIQNDNAHEYKIGLVNEKINDLDDKMDHMFSSLKSNNNELTMKRIKDEH